jgi:hypothetical protein
MSVNDNLAVVELIETYLSALKLGTPKGMEKVFYAKAPVTGHEGFSNDEPGTTFMHQPFKKCYDDKMVEWED